jgi:hypothetical protein
MNLISKINRKINKFQNGGTPNYFKIYGMNPNKFTSMF